VLPALASSTIIAAALALTIPFLLAAQTLLYYDLRSRKAPPTQIEVPVDAPEGEPQPGSDDQPAG
jgi:hypothetical protein